VSTDSVITWTLTRGQPATLKGRLHPLGATTNAKQRIGFSAVAFAKDGTAFTGGSDG